MTQHQFILSQMSTPEKMARWFMERNLETAFDFCEERSECKEIGDQSGYVEDECCLQCLVKWLNASDAMPQMNSFGELVSAVLKENHLRQKDMSLELGVTNSYISKLVRHNERPGKTFTLLFDKTYGFDAEMLFSLIGTQ